MQGQPKPPAGAVHVIPWLGTRSRGVSSHHVCIYMCNASSLLILYHVPQA
jgi:hypothetical protein